MYCFRNIFCFTRFLQRELGQQNVERENIFVRLATFGPIGYLPACGTVATAFSLLFILFFSFLQVPNFLYSLLFFFLLIFGFFVIEKALDFFKKQDPVEIVLDELVGCFIVFWAVPITFFSVVVGFLLFRFFDIVKPFGLKKTELLHGAFGVMMDDILAGLLVNVLLRLILFYWQ